MNNYLSFHTPTQVDLRELFTLGLGSKRGATDKIGHKGSGLKFTLALLHRLESHLVVEVGGTVYTSAALPVSIRDLNHDLIELRCDDGTATACHITTTAGADTWVEPWFALRELYQNTLDEGGVIYADDDGGGGPANLDGTVMRILLTPLLEAAWGRRHEWYNERQDAVVYESASPGLYYHGFLVYKPTSSKWGRSYDVTTLIARDNLSEDRQMRNVDLSGLFGKIVLAAPCLPDALYPEFLDADVGHKDSLLIMNGVYSAINHGNLSPGGFRMEKLEAAWVEKFGERAAYSEHDSESAEWYHATAAGYRPVHVSWEIRRILRYSETIMNAATLTPTLAKRLRPLAISDINLDVKGKLREALRLTRLLRPEACEVVVAQVLHKDDAGSLCGMAVMEENKVILLEQHVINAPLADLVNTLVEEYMHLRSKAGDVTREFEQALILHISTGLMPKKRNLYAL